MGGGRDERAALLARLDGVDGWLYDDEAWRLREAARLAVPDVRSPVVVEIGSFVGRSAICIADGLTARGGGRLYCIDPFDHVDGQLETFERNIAAAGATHLVTPLRAFSHDAVTQVPSAGPVVLLYIDGSHACDDVLIDIADWVPRVERAGIVVFNDPFWRSVAHAIRDGVRGTGLRRPRWVDNCLYFDHDPDRSASKLEYARLRVFLGLGHRWLGLHERLVASARVPQRAKELQLKVVRRLFGLILPKER